MRLWIAGIVLLAAAECRGAVDMAALAEKVFQVPDAVRVAGSAELAKLGDNETLIAALAPRWNKAPESMQAQILGLLVKLAGMNVSSRQHYNRVEDQRVAEALVAALDSPLRDAREEAADLLGARVARDTIQPFDKNIVAMVGKHGNTQAILLLGRIGSAEAVELLKTDKRFRAYSEEQVRAALARAGDKKEETYFIERFKTAKEKRDEQGRISGAHWLGYIGTEGAVLALAQELRTGEIAQSSSYSMRLVVIDALSQAFPKEPVLWNPERKPTNDSYYEKIEEWAVAKLKVKWTEPRPPFFYAMAVPRP